MDLLFLAHATQRAAGGTAPATLGSLSAVATGVAQAWNTADIGHSIAPVYLNGAWWIAGHDRATPKWRIYESTDRTTWTERHAGVGGNAFEADLYWSRPVALDANVIAWGLHYARVSDSTRSVWYRTFNTSTKLWVIASGGPVASISMTSSFLASPDVITTDAALATSGNLVNATQKGRQSETLTKRRTIEPTSATAGTADTEYDTTRDPQIMALDVADDGDLHVWFQSDVDATVYYRHDGGSYVDLSFNGAPIVARKISSNRVACLFRDNATGYLRLILADTSGTTASHASTITVRGAGGLERGHACMCYDGTSVLDVPYIDGANTMRHAQFDLTGETWTDLGAVTGGVDFEVARLEREGSNYIFARAARPAGDAWADLETGVWTPA